MPSQWQCYEVEYPTLLIRVDLHWCGTSGGKANDFVMDEIAHTKRQLIETYLVVHHFRDVSCRDEINLHFSMTRAGLLYHLAIEREWLYLKTDKKMSDRLDQLQVVPFMVEHRAAWVGVTATGQEVVTYVAKDAID